MGIVCTTCHSNSDYRVFADMQPLETTTVCDTCHSPDGTYPGVNGLLNTTLGAKANYKTGGMYEADGISLQAGKEKWCASCHDEVPSVINGATAPIAIVGISAEYHNVTGCQTCHDVSGAATNLKLIQSVINTPNSGAKPVTFTALTGTTSFADGDATYDGPCEVCHTMTGHHQNNGADATAHNDGATCTSCHTHDQQFAAPALPYTQSHQTHLNSKHVSGMGFVCTTCHSAGDPLVFADMQPLATTTVCDICHSPGGIYPGAGGLMNVTLGAKANYKTGGIYEADGVTLKAGKEKWCASCHDESPSVINGATAPIAMVGVSADYHHVTGCQTCHDSSGNSTNLKLIQDVIATPNSGNKLVIFTALTGTNSLADGDATYNGACEVCHTVNAHHNNDGHDNSLHMDGATCTSCHTHDQQFAAPTLLYTQSHQTHLNSKHVNGMNFDCTTCHNDPVADPFVFADMQPLATTTVCDTCHSPGGTYPGAGGLMNATLGAKANYKKIGRASCRERVCHYV